MIGELRRTQASIHSLQGVYVAAAAAALAAVAAPAVAQLLQMLLLQRASINGARRTRKTDTEVKRPNASVRHTQHRVPALQKRHRTAG